MNKTYLKILTFKTLIILADWRIYASVNIATIGSDNDLSPGRRQAIIWINACLLLISPFRRKLQRYLYSNAALGTEVNEF